MTKTPRAPKRVLIATVTCGGGHLQAAAALEAVWKERRPGDVVQRVDVLDFTPRWYRKIYSQGYVKLVERAPELYAYLFRTADRPDRLARYGRFRRMAARAAAGKFLKHVRAFRPDALVATHFFPMEILGAEGNFLKTVVVTDFEVHALWMDPHADLYCVATEASRARLAARGVPRDKIAVTGIPVAPAFSRAADAAAVRRRYGLESRRPVLLVLGGGFGMGPVGKMLDQVEKADGNPQVMIVAGRNEALKAALERRRLRGGGRVFGFVDNMRELMAASDLIMTKPGGLTTAEALALGKPLFVFNPIPGQEEANSDFLLSHGAAVKAGRLEDIPYVLGKALEPRRRSALAKAAAALGRPKAAWEIVKRAAARAAVPLVLASAGVWACAPKTDENLIFFPTEAALEPDGRTWRAPVRGWIFEPEEDSLKRRALLALLKKRLFDGAPPEDTRIFDERARLFLVDNERGKTLRIRAGGRTFSPPPSAANGHVEGTISLTGKPGELVRFQNEGCPGDGRVFEGAVRLVPAEGISVVSDIDDTIKVSHVTDKARLMEAAFLKPYEAVPGMAGLYGKWREAGAVFHYVSASPWQLFPPLEAFLKANGFPDGALYLKTFRWKDRTFFDLFKDPRSHKVPLIAGLFRRFPGRRFVLVGDSGERDPEIYGELARQFSSQVERIYIRRLAGDPSPEDRYRQAFAGLAQDRWVLFSEPSDIP